MFFYKKLIEQSHTGYGRLHLCAKNKTDIGAPEGKQKILNREKAAGAKPFVQVICEERALVWAKFRFLQKWLPSLALLIT